MFASKSVGVWRRSVQRKCLEITNKLHIKTLYSATHPLLFQWRDPISVSSKLNATKKEDLRHPEGCSCRYHSTHSHSTSHHIHPQQSPPTHVSTVAPASNNPTTTTETSLNKSKPVLSEYEDGIEAVAPFNEEGGLDAEGEQMRISENLYISFTCAPCNTRNNNKKMSRRSYEQGVVLIRCEGCSKLHLMADNLGWFDDEKVTIEDIMAEKGIPIKKITGEVEWKVLSNTTTTLKEKDS